MDPRRPGRLLTACVAALSALTAALAAPAPATAGPDDDVARAGRAVERAEAVLERATAAARAAARRLEAATAQLPDAQRKVDLSRGVVAAARVEAGTARRRATNARTTSTAAAERYRAAQRHVDAARARVGEIAAASYMGSDFARLNVLVGARGPQDAIDRLGLVDQIMRKQQADVDVLVRARRAARAEQDRAALARRVAERAERVAAAKLTAARTAEAAAERARAAVQRLAATRAEALAVADSQRATVLAAYRRAQDEEARVVAALRDWDDRQGGGSGTFTGGLLLMPVQGWKSSDFGQRYDPYYRVWQLHAGIDVAAGGGSPIRAAAAGRVIRAGWAGGYGNYTCLSHGRYAGRGLSTCYGHQSEIDVRVGEYVRRGEVIGRVGTTGASTGYHLHFETRFSGEPRDPLALLPACLC